MRTAQLQIRVTPVEKAAIEQAARLAGMGMSSYVLRKVLPRQAAQWNDLLREIDRTDGAKIALATLSNWLAAPKLAIPSAPLVVAHAPAKEGVKEGVAA